MRSVRRNSYGADLTADRFWEVGRMTHDLEQLEQLHANVGLDSRRRNAKPALNGSYRRTTWSLDN
jgi:hypothetical protein